MKSLATRIIAFAVILIMAAGLTTGCAKKEETTATTTETTTTETASNETEATETTEPEKTVAELAKELIKTPNIRVVIGSTSTGGDTYQNAAIIAEKLSEIMDKNVKVDAVGVVPGYDAISRVSDGSTIMIFHDQAYLGYLYGQEGYPEPFSTFNVGPTLSINPGNAYSAPKNSPYNNINDVIEAAGNGETIRVAIQPGGVSEIGFSALKNAVKIEYPGMEGNIVAVNTGSQADKNQLLFDGQADVINSSVQANEQFNQLPADDQKAMKFLWLTAKQETIEQAPEAGFGDTSREELLQYVVPNVDVTQDGTKSFTFDKEFIVLYNKDMSQDIVDLFDRALTEIFAAGEIEQTLLNSFYIPDFRPSAEANAYLKEKMEAYEGILSSIQ